MNTQNANDNIAVVRRLYEARGNPEIIRQVLAPDVRWEVVEGFPYSDVYLGLNGVSDFFTRLFSDAFPTFALCGGSTPISILRLGCGSRS
jgi:hypothetical protein